MQVNSFNIRIFFFLSFFGLFACTAYRYYTFYFFFYKRPYMNKMQFKIQIQSVEMFLREEEIFKGEAKKRI